MPKRFTDTDIWKDQRWFRKLSPNDKLAFYYIKDRCNHAGIWKIDCNDLIEDTGFEKFNINEFMAAVNTEFDGLSGGEKTKDRLLIVKNTHLWITGFLQFQYEGKDKKIAWKGGPAYTAMLQLEAFTLVDVGLGKGYLTLKEPLFEGWQTLKDKDRDRDRDRDSLTGKNKKNEKSETKFSGNFKARGEEILAQRLTSNLAAADRDRKENN